MYSPVSALRAHPAERGCCRFSGFTTTACPLRVDTHSLRFFEVPLSLFAHSLSLQAGTRTLVSAIDLELAPGEILGILGANGAGKSTLLTVLAGLAHPASGEVRLDDVPLLQLPPLTRAQSIGLLPQGDDGTFFGSVAEFVALGRYPFNPSVAQRHRVHLSRPGDRDGERESHPDPAALLQSWELHPLAHRAFNTLSGGERQRARLAQLSIQTPIYYLLDEPLTHLDPAHQARLLTWARSEADLGRAVALTLHDPNWAACHCDRLLFLFGDGRWQVGLPETLLTPASLEALYGPGSAALWGRSSPV
jgi:ABC-type cobalamin/Fe3+-siderophores transport system ATPase subunit